MNIDSTKLKQSLKKQKAPERNDDPTGVVERCFNKGIQVALDIIKFYEEDGNRSMKDYKPLQDGFRPDRK